MAAYACTLVSRVRMASLSVSSERPCGPARAENEKKNQMEIEKKLKYKFVYDVLRKAKE